MGLYPPESNSGFIPRVDPPELLPGVRRHRSCNRHSDCDAADADRNARGLRDLVDFHCHSDDCEDCFGK